MLTATDFAIILNPRMAASPLKVLWIKDTRTGHVNKAKGFLAALAGGPRPLEVTDWNVRWRFPLARHLVSRLQSTCFQVPACCLLEDFPPRGTYDLVVSAGGLTQWPNLLMAKRLGVPNVYLGSPHHFSPSLFSLIPLVDPPNQDPPFLQLEVMTSEMSPAAARASAKVHLPDLAQPAWALLLGGDGEGLKWLREDYLALVDGFLKEAAAAGKATCVATSRRTPAWVEQEVIGRCRAQPGFAGGAWFHSADVPKLPLLSLLGAAERTWVTADSVSMVYEAVASGTLTLAVYPTCGSTNARHQAQFKHSGKLARLDLAWPQPFADLQPLGGWRPVTGDVQSKLAAEALSRLGLA